MTWAETTLGEMLPFRYGKNLPATKRSHSGEFDVVTSAGVVDSHFEPLVTQPAVVIGRKGTIGSLTYCAEPCWPTDTTFFTTGSDSCDVRFGYYFLQTVPLAEMNNDSAVPGLNRGEAESLPIRIPELSRQKLISRLLGSLDDKIAANSEVLSRSSELIRALYSSLPKSECTLGDIADLIRHSEQPKRFQTDRQLIGLEHFDARSLWLTRSSSPESATSAKSCFEAGDTLFGKLRPYFHKVAIAPFNGYCSTDVLVLRAKAPAHAPLVAAAANSDPVVQQAINGSNGTRMPRAKWSDIESCPIPDPAAAVTKEFTELARTLTKDATVRLQENLTLTKTRDELLPLLMSGKITVREAEQEATAAGADIAGEENEA